jgi:hypothetical protein
MRIGVLSDFYEEAAGKQYRQESFMAKVIEFYVPTRHRDVRRWTPEDQRGKVIAFPVVRRETSIWLANGAFWPFQSWGTAPAVPATPVAAKRVRKAE